MKSNPEVALVSLKACRDALADHEDWSEESLHELLMSIPKQIEKKNGQVLFPLRLAITGLGSTPGGAIEIAYILGKEETLRRLDLSIAQLESEAH
jgi:glutamyl-tRNA synthetase